MTTYDFNTQLAKGEEAERALDRHFDRWFDITPASAVEQARGIDRWFVSRASGKRLAIEYKTDWRAAETDNAFIEIENKATSMDAYTAPGWAYTTQADRVLYYCPGSGGEKIYVLPTKRIRTALQTWLKRYPRRVVHNRRYDTTGLLVPLAELECIATQVASL